MNKADHIYLMICQLLYIRYNYIIQEFEVIKINQYKSKQVRTLGIDLYNLYNDLPKAKQQNSNYL
jgi:hypothetical protein